MGKSILISDKVYDRLIEHRETLPFRLSISSLTDSLIIKALDNIPNIVINADSSIMIDFEKLAAQLAEIIELLKQ